MIGLGSKDFLVFSNFRLRFYFACFICDPVKVENHKIETLNCFLLLSMSLKYQYQFPSCFVYLYFIYRNRTKEIIKNCLFYITLYIYRIFLKMTFTFNVDPNDIYQKHFAFFLLFAAKEKKLYSFEHIQKKTIVIFVIIKCNNSQTSTKSNNEKLGGVRKKNRKKKQIH